MHRTESIGYGIVETGEIVLLSDDAAVHLSQGDMVVQRAVIHVWTNRANEICRMAFLPTDGAFEPDVAGKVAAFNAGFAPADA